MKLGKNHPLVKGIQNWSNKGPGSVQREVITKMKKIG
jgi:hypothetical protein